MKAIILILIIVLLVAAPIFVSADCNNSGTTVIFVNGMLTYSENDAEKAKDKLEFLYNNYGKNNDVTFLLGYNPSHIGGLADMVDASVQAYNGGYLDYDLTNILRQVHGDLKTQKILLVGHSQGTFYTNAAYDYLVANGVDRNSIAVYNVGTPADRVAGDGGYLTSSTDKVINEIVKDLTTLGFARKPLPPNIDLKLSPAEESSLIGGHSFNDVYLAEAPDRIIGDMDNELNNLSANNNKEECFVEPKTGIAYWIEDQGYTIVDGVGEYPVAFATTPGPDQLASIANSLLQGIYNLGQQTASLGQQAVSDVVQIFDQNKLFGASLTSAPIQNIISNPTDNSAQQSPAEAPLPAETNSPDNSGEGEPAINSPTSNETNAPDINPAVSSNINSTIESEQDILDNIQEKLDIIKQQVQALVAQQNQNNQIALADENKTSNNESNQNQNTDQNNNQNTDNYNTSESGGGGGGGGGGVTIYPKILISEVQVAGATDEKQEFVELYNPNSQDVDLTDWYLQRKTAGSSSWGTYVSSSLFSGEKITANGYFLIARTGYYSGLADIFTDNPITNDNSFALKNPNGDISDKLGFGQAQDPESSATINPPAGQSIGRKWDSTNNTEQDTDNSSADFELDTLTPRAQNIAYSSPTQSDTTAPVITLNGASEVTVNAGDTYADAGAAASDDTDGNITAKIVIVNPVNINVIGDYTITYNVSDVAGNQAVEVTRLVHVVAIPKILINEIQIDSIVGAGGTDDDWVELYNPTGNDVSLKGWSVQKFSSDNPCSLNKGYYKKNFPDDAVIKAKSFFLLISTQANDTLKSLISSDSDGMTIGWSLSDNNTIYLVGKQDEITDGSDANIVDKVGFGSTACFSETSPAPTPPEANSIQRIWDIIANEPQDTDDNSADFHIFNATTPKAASPESCSIIYNGFTFAQNTTLKKSCTYWFKNNNTVSNGATLTINPGVVIKFADSSLIVDGTLKAIGTTDQPIVFTSINDTDYGGDIRAAGNTTTVSPGQWSGILFKQDSTGSDLENIILRYGGSDLHGSCYGAGIRVDQSSITLKNSVVEKNLNYGIRLTNSSSVIDTVQFNYHKMTDYDTLYGKAVYIEGGNPEIENCIFKNNYDSVYLTDTGQDTSPSIENDDFEGNHDSIYLTGKNVHPNFSGNKATNNDYDAIIFAEQIGEDMTISPDMPYLIKQAFNIPQNITLTIEPGVVIKFSDSSLTVDGTLKAIGTTDQPIVFTSIDDDDYGGHIKAVSDNTPVCPGQWSGILFKQDSTGSDLENVIVRYAGGVLNGYIGAGIKVDQSVIFLKNSLIQNNAVNGVWLANSPSTIDSVQFLDNKSFNGSPNVNGLYIQGASPEIDNSYFGDNNYGIYMDALADNPPTPVLENNNFGPVTDTLDPENKSYGPNTIKDIYDASLPPPGP